MWVYINETTDEAAVAAIACAQYGLKDLAQRIDTERDIVHSDTTNKIREAADEKYGQEGDREIRIDEDAPVHENEEHSFVQAWVYITHKEAGVADTDDADAEEANQGGSDQGVHQGPEQQAGLSEADRNAAHAALGSDDTTRERYPRGWHPDDDR